jgi:hypothetical protein
LIPCVLCFAAALAGCVTRPLDVPGDMSGDMNVPMNGDMNDQSLSGTFARCAETIVPDSTADFLGVSGFLGSLTLAQSGSLLSMTYNDTADDITQPLPFSLSEAALASLAHGGESLEGFPGLCVMGPEDESPFPAFLDVDAAHLQYQAGTVFVAVDGTLTGTGECGTVSSPASYLLACDQASPAVQVAPPPASSALLPSGQYACGASINATVSVGGTTDEGVIDGSGGTLTLTQDGSTVTLDYEGDYVFSGTLQLTATSATTAIMKDQQALSAKCETPAFDLGSIASLPVTAGALSIFGSGLTLSFTGTAGADTPCPGTYIVGTLTCSMM